MTAPLLIYTYPCPTGNCFDNAAIESFFCPLKAEFFHLERPDSIDTLKAGVQITCSTTTPSTSITGCRGSVRRDTALEASPDRGLGNSPTSVGHFNCDFAATSKSCSAVGLSHPSPIAACA